MRTHRLSLNLFRAAPGSISPVAKANIFRAATGRILVAAAVALLANLASAATPAADTPTAVTGESWLQHLHRSFDETSMGKTGRLGPPEATAESEDSSARAPENATVMVHGSDLYRMNCRGCHGETGAGAPPEINSLINPVRATSAFAVLERVKATGAQMSYLDAAKLAQQSKTMLLDRLHHGGQDMPPFPHLSDSEIDVLVAYLRDLAGVPPAGSSLLAVREQRVRIGEHIAKSTCHVCHSAAGPNPTLAQLYAGEIPPLSALPLRTTRAQFIRKVTQGAPILMGEPAQLLRGRMPVFYYLSVEEAGDVYLYLTAYPPTRYAESATTASGAGVGADHPGDALSNTVLASDSLRQITPAPRVPAAILPAEASRAAGAPSQVALADEQVTVLALLLGMLAGMVLLIGFWVTVWELKRLSGEQSGTLPVDPKSAASVTKGLAREAAA